MNITALVGRLTSDPSVKYATSGTAVARFTVAVSRNDKEKNTDFISCIAFGKTAEFIEKYFSKGSSIGLTGKIQTSSYEKDGRKVYTTDVVADRVEFVGSKSEVTGSKSEIPEGFAQLDEDLPF